MAHQRLVAVHKKLSADAQTLLQETSRPTTSPPTTKDLQINHPYLRYLPEGKHNAPDTDPNRDQDLQDHLQPDHLHQGDLTITAVRSPRANLKLEDQDQVDRHTTTTTYQVDNTHPGDHQDRPLTDRFTRQDPRLTDLSTVRFRSPRSPDQSTRTRSSPRRRPTSRQKVEVDAGLLVSGNPFQELQVGVTVIVQEIIVPLLTATAVKSLLVNNCLQLVSVQCTLTTRER